MAATSFSYRAATTQDDSSSDSDSDKECHDWKRATNRNKEEDKKLEKIPIQPFPVPSNTSSKQKKKRNNIWCEVLEDQMMSETLNHCGLKQKPRNYFNRGEESYDYTLKYKSKDDDGDCSGDDDMDDNSSELKSKSLKTSCDSRPFGFKNNCKFVKLDPAELAAAKKIVKILNEDKKYLIFRVVKHVGIEKAMHLLEQTQEIEDKGGMMVLKNTRRRSPGGVYLQLLKADKDIKKEAVDKIFEGEMNSFEAKKKFDEMKKQKKQLRAQKKKAEAMLNQLVSTQTTGAEDIKSKQDRNETTVKVETEQARNVADDSMETEEMPGETTQSDTPLALEDGEIDD